MDDGFHKVFDYLTEALRKASEERISKEEAIPAILDFATMNVLIVGGERGVHLAIERMQERLVDWKEGRFPAPSTETP